MAAFHTPEALREFVARDTKATTELLLARPNDHPRLRPYQWEANTAIEQAIANRKRQMLVATATGTGKTFTMVNEVYPLMRSGVAKRILFLVDRRALADPSGLSAIEAQAAGEEEPTDAAYLAEVGVSNIQNTSLAAGPIFQLSNLVPPPGPAFQNATGNLFLDQVLGPFFSLAKDIVVVSHNLASQPTSATNLQQQLSTIAWSVFSFGVEEIGPNKWVSLALDAYKLATAADVAQ